ncbi:hypothetical protein HMPREF9392_0981 [Streptococcus sanguinis SK678]|nr:hypothetical protein HMPREF9392_0981 [Streptococcus sanguinis SK678]EGJ44095.1 hypothetical protein HMPREF9396_1017 [Streptococcus sanguinis SK1059]EGQ20366.1 hypothetical protein HMPREF8573_1006 [Streptococcus sanguinis ATCC 29667]EGQ23993.1 hypothetical protein HMPREF9387_1558 [Streptococcus sanguinis SK340]
MTAFLSKWGSRMEKRLAKKCHLWSDALSLIWAYYSKNRPDFQFASDLGRLK